MAVGHLVPDQITNYTNMFARSRQPLLLLTLAGAVTLAVFAPAPETGVAVSTPTRPASLATGVAASPPLRAANGDAGDVVRMPLAGKFPPRGTLAVATTDLWSPQFWQPPAPKVAAVPPSMQPPPAPPAMLYRYAGQILLDGHLQVFVSKDDTPIAVKPGDSLDGYVVELISPDAITLIYPPLGNKASISISPAVSL